MKKFLVTIFSMLGVFFALAQKTYPVEGMNDVREGYYAFTNATIYATPDRKLEKATLIIKDGKVVAVGTGLPLPKDAVAIDLNGKVVYPSFIDIYSNYAMPAPKPGEHRRNAPQTASSKKGAFAWNEALKPETKAADMFATDDKAAEPLRQQGFGAVLTHQMDGISRGSSALVLLGNEAEPFNLLKAEAANQLSFSKGTSTQNYPSSLMGCIALLKQTYLDADWYKNNGHMEERNLSLEAWNKLQNLPQIFEANDKLNILRAAKLGKEFGATYIIKSGGDEYQRLEEVKAAASPLIVPINFPDAYDVENPYAAQLVGLADMKHWEMAPSNPARLSKAGIDFALTANGLKSTPDFLKNLRKAIAYGLSETDALKALTTTPARLIKASDLLGSLETGKTANFIIADGNIFEEKTAIYQNWINGKPYIIKQWGEQPPVAVYDLTYGNKQTMLFVEGDPTKPKALIAPSVALKDSLKKEAKFELAKGIARISFAPDSLGTVNLVGTESGGGYKGRGTLPSGEWADWSATPNRAVPEKSKEENKEAKTKKPDMGTLLYPFLAYGWENKPQAETVLFKNATVWTNEAEGIAQSTDVLIQNGKIAKIGKSLPQNGATVIDASGKHLTSGIIDEHSHIAISRGVNEGTQYSSAEVSIGDVVNSEDINLYRQLAGGVTAAQLLHGSANPIGGQSAIIKLRWGASPEEMKIQGADPFIKFALGENVKQSNWGDNFRERFPQTRMGVEQVYDDHFTRAREYGELKRSGKAYRKDLEMEAVLQIINKQRFITCHSYVQSEINMLMKVAERHGFRINTFTHILEGYKVADKMAKHGVGGSTFADWWAYKYEVIDAIPQNAAILNEQGVTTAINSDDAEMGRRLNQEAAKSVLYGGMSEEDAWKLVTLNPAKLLHIDKQTGSIKVGKDADVVLWSDNPLSIYAKPDMTFVDGKRLFDRQANEQKRLEVQAERARLIQKMLAEKKGGGKVQAAQKREQHLYHCDDMEDEMGEKHW
jgi:imidazolonepropionase-like amidohydrolase